MHCVQSYLVLYINQQISVIVNRLFVLNMYISCVVHIYLSQITERFQAKQGPVPYVLQVSCACISLLAFCICSFSILHQFVSNQAYLSLFSCICFLYVFIFACVIVCTCHLVYLSSCVFVIACLRLAQWHTGRTVNISPLACLSLVS